MRKHGLRKQRSDLWETPLFLRPCFCQLYQSKLTFSQGENTQTITQLIEVGNNETMQNFPFSGSDSLKRVVHAVQVWGPQSAVVTDVFCPWVLVYKFAQCTFRYIWRSAWNNSTGFFFGKNGIVFVDLNATFAFKELWKLLLALVGTEVSDFFANNL